MLMTALLTVIALPIRARAAETPWETEELRRSLPAEAAEYLAGEEPDKVDGGTAERIGGRVLGKLGELKRGETAFALLLFSVVTASSFASSAGEGGSAENSALLASVAAVSSAALTEMKGYLELSRTALQNLSDYADVLLPTLAAAGSVTGRLTSSAGKCAATAIFMSVLIRLARSVIMPLICGYAALSAADAAVGNSSLKAAGKLLHSACGAVLSALALSFTFWITAISLTAGSADAAAAKVTKTVLTSSLPVVGKILSDASGTLGAAAETIRGTAGVFGMLAVLCVCLTPCLRLGLRLLVYKLTAAVCRCLCGSRLASLLDSLGEVFAMLLGLIGTAALAVFISVFSLVRAVN